MGSHDLAPTFSLSLSHGPEFPHVVLRFEARAGRNRSAGRTEVHLVATTSLTELTFCPFTRTSGVGKEVRRASQRLTAKTRPRSPQIPGKRLTAGSRPPQVGSRATDP